MADAINQEVFGQAAGKKDIKRNTLCNYELNFIFQTYP